MSAPSRPASSPAVRARPLWHDLAPDRDSSARAKSAQYAAMTTTIGTEHPNELILVEEVLDSGGAALVALGLVNQDGSNTFPGRTLSPDQAEELAASLALSAAVARASAGVAEAPSAGEQARAETLIAIRAAVPLGEAPTVTDDVEAEAEAAAEADAEAAAEAAAAGEGEPDTAPPALQSAPVSAEPEELPIDGYDDLKAAVISKRLAGLTAAELGKVLAYEQRHRNRKTVCERIIALQASAARDATVD